MAENVAPNEEKIWVESSPLDQYRYEKHPINKEDEDFVVSVTGNKYLETIKETGSTLYSLSVIESNGNPNEAPFRIFYYHMGDTTIILKIKNGEDREIAIDFIKTLHFRQDYGYDTTDSILRDSPDNTNYSYVDHAMSQESIKLFHHLEKSATEINDDCKLILRPTSQRRERIYWRLVRKHPEKTNFIIEHTVIDDRHNADPK